MINFTINFQGKDYIGRYEINRGIIKVEYGLIEKKTQIGGHVGAPKLLAEMMLREIIKENKI
jgi:hypothetical protein